MRGTGVGVMKWIVNWTHLFAAAADAEKQRREEKCVVSIQWDGGNLALHRRFFLPSASCSIPRQLNSAAQHKRQRPERRLMSDVVFRIRLFFSFFFLHSRPHTFSLLRSYFCNRSTNSLTTPKIIDKEEFFSSSPTRMLIFSQRERTSATDIDVPKIKRRRRNVSSPSRRPISIDDVMINNAFSLAPWWSNGRENLFFLPRWTKRHHSQGFFLLLCISLFLLQGERTVVINGGVYLFARRSTNWCNKSLFLRFASIDRFSTASWPSRGQRRCCCIKNRSIAITSFQWWWGG